MFSLERGGKSRILAGMEELLRLRLSATCAAYASATDSSRAKIGSLILNDNTFFRRVLDEHQGFTVRIYDRVMQWFADHWPEGVKWPAEVPRPTPPAPEVAA